MPGQTEPTYHWPIPEYDDLADGPLAFQQLGNGIDTSLTAVQSGTVMRFATKAARDAALVGALAPVPGMMCYCADIKRIEMYATIGTWSGWTPMPGTQVADFGPSVNQPIPITSWTGITLQTTTRDLLGGMQANRVTYKPGVPGVYFINAAVSFVANATGVRAVYFVINAAYGGPMAVATASGNSTSSTSVQTFLPLFMNATDTIQMVAYQTGLSPNLNTDYASTRLCLTYAGPGP